MKNTKIKKLSCIFFIVILLITGCGKFSERKPVNVIFIVPDGFSYAVWSSVRYMSVGSQGLTALDRFPHSARYSTSAYDSWITDSAAGITAIMTGHKCANGILSQDSTAVYKKSSGNDIQTLMEYAATQGMATGIITNTSIYHATPAGCYAHEFDRGAYANIVSQLIDGEFTPDIIMGGGRQYMFPADYADPESGKLCSRKDDRNITAELEKKGYKYFDSQSGFEEWNTDTDKKALGLFDYSHMLYEMDRKDDKLGEPSLWEMTEKTLNTLDGAEKGFFLLVEAGKIDHAAHGIEEPEFLYECFTFDKTLKVVLDFLENNPNTLVLAATDHGCGGANGIGFRDSSGIVDTDGFPGVYTHNEKELFPDSLKVAEPIVIGWASNPLSMEIDTVKYDYRSTHTAEDGIAFAAGYSSENLNGYISNTDLYNIMRFVMPHESEGEGAVIPLNPGAVDHNKQASYGYALFLAKIEPGQKLTLQVYNMVGERLFETEKTATNDNPVELKWTPSRPVHVIPGIFRYEWYIDGKFQSAHTFILS